LLRERLVNQNIDSEIDAGIVVGFYFRMSKK